MITEDFTLPLIVKVDGVWRPVMGKILEEKIEGTFGKMWVVFLLNGKVLEEAKSRCWRSFDKNTAFSKLKQYAIKYNIVDMDYKIASLNTAERIEKRDRIEAQRPQRPPDENGNVLPRFRRAVILS